MNLIFILLIALPLTLTLIIAAVLDAKYREVKMYTWIPCIILGFVGMLTGAYNIDAEFCKLQMICYMICAAILIASSLNQYLLVTKRIDKIYFGFADALCILTICFVKPVTLGMPTIAPLFLIAGLMMCGGFMIPNIAKKWTENTPFIIPLGIGGVLCLLF